MSKVLSHLFYEFPVLFHVSLAGGLFSLEPVFVRQLLLVGTLLYYLGILMGSICYHERIFKYVHCSAGSRVPTKTALYRLLFAHRAHVSTLLSAVLLRIPRGIRSCDIRVLFCARC